jgi:hypothetical protein
METEEKRNEMLFFTFRTKNVNKSKEKSFLWLIYRTYESKRRGEKHFNYFLLSDSGRCDPCLSS